MINNAQLIDKINSSELLEMSRCAGGHDDQMKGLIKNSEVIAHWNENDYQGMVATCLNLDSGEFVIYNDYYGSCFGCDAWEDASDNDVTRMCIQLASTAKIFGSLDEVKEFLSITKYENKDYSWDSSSKQLLTEINKSQDVQDVENE